MSHGEGLVKWFPWGRVILLLPSAKPQRAPNLNWLAVSTPLKNMTVTWDDDIPNLWKNKKCSKPPTSKKTKLNDLKIMLRDGKIILSLSKTWTPSEIPAATRGTTISGPGLASVSRTPGMRLPRNWDEFHQNTSGYSSPYGCWCPIPSPNDTAPLSHLSPRRRRRKGEQDLQQQQMTEIEPEPWLVRIDVMQVVIIESHDRKQDPGDQVLWPQHGVSTAVPCWIPVFPSELSIGKSPENWVSGHLGVGSLTY